MEERLKEVSTAAALLLELKEENERLRQCAEQAVREILAWCGLQELPEDGILIAARRAVSLYEETGVKSVRRGDFSVSYEGGERDFYKSLTPFRRMRF